MRDLSSNSLITIVVTRMIVKLNREHAHIEQCAIDDKTMKKMQFDISFQLSETIIDSINLAT